MSLPFPTGRFAVVAAAAVAGALLWVRRAPEPPAAGIPLTLAQDRAARISNLKYEARFRVPARKDEPVRGTIAARFSLRDAKAPLAFDFAQTRDHVIAVRVNQRAIEPVIEDGYLRLMNFGAPA